MDPLRLFPALAGRVEKRPADLAPRGRDKAARLQGPRVVIPLLLGLLLYVGSWVPVLADDATDLINELMCPSDCVETLAICQMTEAAQMRDFIKEKVAGGWSKQQVVDTLVAQYGERILAAPTKQGFNLTAWITPFAAILGGGAFISVLVADWVRRRRIYDGLVKTRVAEPDEGDPEGYRARLAAELKDFE